MAPGFLKLTKIVLLTKEKCLFVEFYQPLFLKPEPTLAEWIPTC